MRIQACAHCSHFLKVESPLCQNCWNKVLPYLGHGRTNGYPWPVYSLFEWRTQPVLHTLFHALKGDRFKDTHDHFASWLLTLKGGIHHYSEFVLVPAPPRNLLRKSTDHAGLFAQALFAKSGLPVVDMLMRDGDKTQKWLRRQERAGAVMKLKSPRLGREFRKVIFVDDVVTTGNTAKAAYIALGEPAHFEVWSIGCRPKGVLV